MIKRILLSLLCGFLIALLGGALVGFEVINAYVGAGFWAAGVVVAIVLFIKLGKSKKDEADVDEHL